MDGAIVDPYEMGDNRTGLVSAGGERELAFDVLRSFSEEFGVTDAATAR